MSRSTGFYHALADLWTRQGIEVGEASDVKALEAWETLWGLALPSAVRDYLSAVGGTGTQYDETDIRFLCLNEMEPMSRHLADHTGTPDYSVVASAPEADQQVVFAEYLIYSHVYVFDTARPEGPVSWVCGSQVKPMQDSFAGFLQRYLDSPESVLFPT